MRPRIASSLLLLSLAGCHEPAREAPPRAEAQPAAQAAAAPPGAAPAPPATGRTIAIAAGTLRVGSRPGTPGRNPALEADEVPIELGAFEIERAPYPSRDGSPPRTAVSRAEAAALCAQEGKRLCSELEWERACDERAIETVSGIAEWTASSADARFEAPTGLAVVRGILGDGAQGDRCAARGARAPDAREGGIGFRCCAGELADAPYPAEPTRRNFRPVDVSVDSLRSALARVPELARFAAEFEPFTADEVSAVFTRGNVEPVLPEGVRRAEGVLEWAPGPGELAWVVTGRSGGSSLVAVLYPLPDGGFAHASSMILEGDPLSVLVTYLPGNARSLSWSTCFGCAGEGGEIQYREGGRIVVVQL